MISRVILSEIQVRLNRDVSAGAVYATLERLETKGLVSSKLAPGTGKFAAVAPGDTSDRESTSGDLS